MPSCSVVIGYVHEERLLRGCVEQIAALAHPDIETEIIVVDQSGGSAIADVSGITRIVAPKVDAGTAMNVGIRIASGEYVCTLDADAFPLRADWLALPIKLIHRHGFTFVGNSTGMQEHYAPTLGPFLHLNNYFRVSRTDLAKEIVEDVGFQRAPYRSPSGGIDTDNGVRAMRHAATLGPCFSLPITHCLGHTPEMGLYGMVIADLVFHLVFGFAEDWIVTMEKTLGAPFLALRAKLFSEGLTPDNIAMIRAALQPVSAFGYRLWDGTAIHVLDGTDPLIAEVESLKVLAVV